MRRMSTGIYCMWCETERYPAPLYNLDYTSDKMEKQGENGPGTENRTHYPTDQIRVVNRYLFHGGPGLVPSFRLPLHYGFHRYRN